MPMIEWNDVAAPQKPPEKERLLLITAADEFDAQLKGQSEVEVGYWTGNHFRFMRDDSIAHRVARWAILHGAFQTTSGSSGLIRTCADRLGTEALPPLCLAKLVKIQPTARTIMNCPYTRLPAP